MADYFTHFSRMLNVGKPENAARALELYNALSAEGATEDPPFKAFLSERFLSSPLRRV